MTERRKNRTAHRSELSNKLSATPNRLRMVKHVFVYFTAKAEHVDAVKAAFAEFCVETRKEPGMSGERMGDLNPGETGLTLDSSNQLLFNF